MVTPDSVDDDSDRPPNRSLDGPQARRWYNGQVAKIPHLDKAWEASGVSLEDRAKRAHGIRHGARVASRDMMSNRLGVKLLQVRDRWKYQNKDGPTFEGLVASGRKKGLSDDKIHRGIIDSSNRTNARVNRRYDNGAPEGADGKDAQAGGGMASEKPKPPATAPKGKDAASGAQGKPDAAEAAQVKAVKDETKALKGKTNALKDDLKAMQDHEGAKKKTTSSMGKSPKSFTDLSKAIKDSSGAQKSVQGATKSWIGTHGKLNASMLKSPLGLMVQGITAAIGVITLIITHWDTIKQVFETVKKTVLDPVGDFFKTTIASATAGFKSVTEGISNAFGSLGTKIEEVFHSAVRHVAVVVMAIGGVLQNLNVDVPSWLGGGSIGFGGIGDLMVSWAKAHMANGGLVRGPGGPRDDLVPIAASNGEFVVNAASTARHVALLEAINNDTLGISGRDAQVMAVRSGSFAVPTRGMPSVANAHHFDHSTTINLVTHHVDSAHARAKTLAAQREVAASWQ